MSDDAESHLSVGISSCTDEVSAVGQTATETVSKLSEDILSDVDLLRMCLYSFLFSGLLRASDAHGCVPYYSHGTGYGIGSKPVLCVASGNGRRL